MASRADQPTPWGAHSEVGRLRRAMVCRPGRAQLRVKSRHHSNLAGDGVLWVERADQEHAQLVATLRERGVEVLELHTLLAQALASPEARQWAIAHRLGRVASGWSLQGELQAALTDLPPDQLADILIGGLTRDELPWHPSPNVLAYLEMSEYVLAPLPESIWARDSSAWVHHGLALCPMAARDRRAETALAATVTRFHPRFAAAAFPHWLGEQPTPSGAATLDGSDVMPLGDGAVLMGLSERTSPDAVLQLAQALFDSGAAKVVVAAQLPSSHATCPLDAWFTPCSREVVTYCPEAVDHMTCHEIRPAPQGAGVVLRTHPGKHLLDVLSEVLQVPTLNAIACGGEARGGQVGGSGREGQWDAGNNLLAIEPGVVLGFERNASTHRHLRQAGIDVIEIPGAELGRSGRGPHGLVCPLARDAVRYR